MTTLVDRLLGRTGRHRRDSKTWAALEAAAAKLEAQDALIADLVQQRDEQRRLADAAAAQVEQFRHRVTQAESAAAEAHRDAIAARAELANATVLSLPLYAPDADTQELPITRVRTLQDALGQVA